MWVLRLLLHSDSNPSRLGGADSPSGPGQVPSAQKLPEEGWEPGSVSAGRLWARPSALPAGVLASGEKDSVL